MIKLFWDNLTCSSCSCSDLLYALSGNDRLIRKHHDVTTGTFQCFPHWMSCNPTESELYLSSSNRTKVQTITEVECMSQQCKLN